MAVTVIASFESGQIQTEGITNLTGTANFSTVQARTGTRSFRANPASGANGWVLMATTFGWTHFAIYVATMPSAERRIFGTGTGVDLRLNSAGALDVYNSGSFVNGVVAVVTGQWYWIGLRTNAGTGEILQINGVNQGFNTTTVATSQARLGTDDSVASAIDIYYDDYVVDNAGFLASTKVGQLLPVSDNSVGGNWTTGAGGTSSLFDGIDNVPPVGVTSTGSETATSNVKVSNQTAAYVVNMATFGSIGINSWDAIIAVRQVIQHGSHQNLASGSTTSLATSFGLSNVNQSYSTSQHGATPTNWTTTFGNLAANATGFTIWDLATNYTHTITKTDINGFIVCVDFLALQVAWTPGIQPSSGPAYVGAGYYGG
jgi:hypothetical protein